MLILGVDDKDNQASGVKSIPNALAVADTLHRAFTSRIDPYPVGLEVYAVDYDQTGGVIIARVPASAEAPHGVKKADKGKTYFMVTVRRGEETKPLDMRDIQLHTLESRRRADATEARIDARRKAFQDLRWRVGSEVSPFGYRITVLPARAVYRVPELGKLMKSNVLVNGLAYEIELSNDRQTGTRTSFHRALTGTVRPCLRGMTAAQTHSHAGFFTFTVFEDGTVDVVRLFSATEPKLHGWQMLGDYLGAIQLAQAMRCKAAAGRAELIINAELASTGAEEGGQPARIDMALGIPDDLPHEARDGIQTPLGFPQYTLVGPEDLSRVAAEFWQDLCDVSGEMGMPRIERVTLKKDLAF